MRHLIAPKSLRSFGVGCVIAAVLASPSAGSTHPAAIGCIREPSKQFVASRHYLFTLLVGPVENMYMPYQVRASHLKHGEVMLRGKMTTGAMLSGGPVHHLEVQICVRPRHSVVTNATPKIVLHDLTTPKVLSLPVSVMEGIGEGAADLHYGNNVALRRNHRFSISASWRSDRATFLFHSP